MLASGHNQREVAEVFGVSKSLTTPDEVIKATVMDTD